MIIKVQLPIFGDMSKCLIYNKSHSIHELAPIKIGKEAFGKSKDIKGFFKAELINTILHIGCRVSERNW